MSEPKYPDARKGTFVDGLAFQDLVCMTLLQHGIILQNFASTKMQFTMGENPQGFEIKLDRRCTETGQLSIEVAEKSKADLEHWTPSGIHRKDNTWLYIQGNETVFFVFSLGWLRRWEAHHNKNGSLIYHTEKTVKGWFLSMEDAKKYAERVFIVPPDLATMVLDR